MNEIRGIGGALWSSAARVAEGSAGGDDSFAAALGKAVRHVRQLEMDSAAEIRSFLTGDSEDLHKVLLSVQKSELAFEMLLQVRNKAVQAYQEIMRMQV